MCGRFTLTIEEAELLAAELGVPVESLPRYRPRYNIAPTDNHWIVRMKYEHRELLPASWGLVNSWAKDKSRQAARINARAETLETRSVFKEAFRERRCVVPADGSLRPETARQPIWIHRPGGGLLLFAGLYEYWPSGPDTWERTFTIMTTDANGTVAPVHDRMPVILSDDAVDAWLMPRQEIDEVKTLLAPAPEEVLIATAVSPRANSVKNDDRSVLEEVATPSLF